MATQTQQDITAINNYAGQYSKEIRLSVYNGLDILNDLNLITNLTAPRDMPKYKANEGFRPYNTNVRSPRGQAGKFSKRTITPRAGMKILTVIPEELRKTYLSEGLKANAKEYPSGFAQYFWEEQTNKLQEEINNNSYLGVDGDSIPAFDPGVAYAVGNRVQFDDSFYQAVAVTTAGQSPSTHTAKWLNVDSSSVSKGIGTIIAEEYAGLPARQKIATGTIDATNAFDKVTAFYLSIPEEYRNLGGIIRCSRSTYDNYNMSLLAKFTSGTSFMDVLDQTGKPIAKSIFGSDGKWVLQPHSWMSGSKRLIADIKKNLYSGTDMTSDYNSLGTQVPFVHGYDCKFQLILAFQIADLELLFVNDQA